MIMNTKFFWTLGFTAVIVATLASKPCLSQTSWCEDEGFSHFSGIWDYDKAKAQKECEKFAKKEKQSSYNIQTKASWGWNSGSYYVCCGMDQWKCSLDSGNLRCPGW